MAQFTITASNITTNSATIELTSEIAHTAASSVDVTVVSSNGVEAYAGTTTIPVGSIGDVISVPVTGLKSNMEYTVTAKTGTTYTDTGTFTTTDDPTARTATQSQWEDLADKVEAASVAQSTLYDTPGTNIDGAMTQLATTSLIDSLLPGAHEYTGRINIGFRNYLAAGTENVYLGYYLNYQGGGSTNYGSYNISIGYNTGIGNRTTGVGSFNIATNNRSSAYGTDAQATGQGSVAIGAHSRASQQGQMDIGTSSLAYGYNSSNYRLLSGVYDGQSAHDAVTKGQLDTAIINGGATAPTTSTVGAVGTLYSYVDPSTNTPHLYSCTDTTGGTYTWVQLI